ncbi:hypothetical protein PR202_ga30847 [Eleusine coracana subsp. coracana]|uniref:Uncharacterized protein n=1 Tax=Eleusine coracana subsp. coracana TaxID=191504 RepID=A0AAV5DQU6_ELECO|nr:hypothetical protein PR202_ga30847 [Eleusine coracana subsp. coracana]
MDVGGEDARALIVTIHDDNTDAPTRTHEQAILMKERRMVATAERLEADFNKVHTKIPRFPRGLRGIGGDDG